MGGTDTATYSGSALDETMTALAFYTFVNTASTVQYFDRFPTLTVAGNGGLDIAVMYDSAGVDTFTASDSSFQYLRTGVFNNLANGYDKVYAFSLFGSFDTATLNGSSGNDKLTSIANYSVLVTPTTLQQATSFRTVIVNAGTGTDTATLQDSAGNDTLNAFASTAELVYANGRTVRAIASTRSTPTARSAARIVAISTPPRINSSSKELGSKDDFRRASNSRPRGPAFCVHGAWVKRGTLVSTSGSRSASKLFGSFRTIVNAHSANPSYSQSKSSPLPKRRQASRLTPAVCGE